ncbi:MAG: hypothetical protein OXG66_19595 [Acidimicrobiaceae bacterium]|nr:hypothetical protein [Acidimicrobiaceae bacterium]
MVEEIRRRAEYQRDHPLSPAERDDLLADESADPETLDLLAIPMHWSSSSSAAWTLGGGMRLLSPYGRRRWAVGMLVHQFGFVLDNPEPRDSIRLSMAVLRTWTGRAETTMLQYLAILDAAGIIHVDGSTYKSGPWFPYPAINETDFREDWRYPQEDG